MIAVGYFRHNILSALKFSWSGSKCGLFDWRPSFIEERSNSQRFVKAANVGGNYAHISNDNLIKKLFPEKKESRSRLHAFSWSRRSKNSPAFLTLKRLLSVGGGKYFDQSTQKQRSGRRRFPSAFLIALSSIPILFSPSWPQERDCSGEKWEEEMKSFPWFWLAGMACYRDRWRNGWANQA